MPFLRVIRDKRGYETTYLMHWYREGTRQRSRILYVFRSPGGLRVGRESLEPAILRDIEASYPDIAFDWKAVLDNKQIVETAPDIRRPRKRRRSEDEAAAATEPASTKPPDGERSPKASGGEVGPKPSHGEGGRPPIPLAIEGATPDEQTAFLARWYSIVRERIPQRTADPARREALLALAERMNPANWTDADQIAAGLQPAGEALERLSRVFARRRRRPRRVKGSDKSGPREQPASPKPQSGEGGPAALAAPKPQGDGGPKPEGEGGPPDTPRTDE